MDANHNIDEFFMRAAISEAMQALEKEEVPVGAVVVGGGRILGRGHNLVETLSDSTAHAEMLALTAAMQTITGKYLHDCTLYVTVEPCAMCAGAAAWSKIGRIVCGAADPKRGFSRYSLSILHPKTEFVSGVLAKACSDIMSDFFRKLRDTVANNPPKL